MISRVKADETITEAMIRKAKEDNDCSFLEEPVDFIHSGCNTLNLCLSGKAKSGGWARNRVLNLVGDGSSGKTLCALELCAVYFYMLRKGLIKSKIWQTPNDVDIVYNNGERVMDFPVEEMYGRDFYQYVNWAVQSPTVEHLGHDFFNRVAKLPSGNSLLYVIDSWDALDSEEDLLKFVKKLEGTFKHEADKKATEKESGSYELGKQKYASKRFFKHICKEMHGKDVTLLIVSQVRKRIGVTFGEKLYRAGGDALNFYTHQVCWLAEVQKLKKQSLGYQRVYGIKSKARVKRSKVALPYREAEFDIIFNYGIDDIGSTVSWFFGPQKQEIQWEGIKYKRDDLLQALREDPELYGLLLDQMEEKWKKVDHQTNPLIGLKKYD